MPEQGKLFDYLPEPWEADDQSERLVATVVLLKGPEKELDYEVPDALRESVEPGKRVKVPLGRGNRPTVGYCVRLENKPTGRRALKPVQTVLDECRLLSSPLLRLSRWMADYYLCPWAAVLETILPAGVRSQAGTRLTTLLTADPQAAQCLAEEKLPAKQLAVMKILASAPAPMTAAELARSAKCTSGPIQSLRRKGLIRAQTARVQLPPQHAAHAVREKHLVLNADQQKALDVIREALGAQQHRTILVHGVTGSGKTEIYIQAIQEVLHFGRQAIVLVPEISLTPQTVERFRLRFGEVAVLHSHLSDAERHWHWQRIAEGRVPVVVGARSAIFAPAPHLGLIVLDEEHETSFKQETAPRYHARDVALYRAEAEGVPLVLGSATPSLESWHEAQVGRYKLVELPRRVLDRPLPMVGTVDLRIDRHRRAVTRGSIGRQLHAAVARTLEADGQVILLLNRRGYSTHIQCPACGHVVMCPHCDIALTHHRKEEIALCHFCDYEIPTPASCPACQFAGIRYSGVGTQRLEAEVRARFPNVPCLRMDTDTMQGRGSHERALAAFRAGKVKILLGTQMIAKGLDFPNVTLVGVINADTALHLPDFRAAERTFHLVTQVAGRTGRGEKGGRVLVQTFNPEHPAIQAAVRHDYAAFAAGELPLRQMLRYPPFASMIRLVIRGPTEPTVHEFAKYLGERLREAIGVQDSMVESRRSKVEIPPPTLDPRPSTLDQEVRVLGPAPAPFAKLRGQYRFQIQLQGPDGDRLRTAVRQTAEGLEPPEGVQWIVDVDPVDMM
ncbi:MAG: primosomal protein N' [Pirellulales bacterium]|nr:primosomal protein N' [Pirellulales bacterium]